MIALLISNSYYQLIMTIVPIWAVMGLSWNLLSGYSGLISFGHAAFFGLGAYLVALCLSVWNLSPWFTIVLATITGGISGLLVGLPTFRLRGHYFALAMLAYPLALLYIFEWLGYQEVALPMNREAPLAYMQFENPFFYVLIAVILLMLVMAITSMLSHSRFGLSLLAIKLDEDAAEAAGINTLYWKLVAIAVSGAIAGAAGGFYAVVLLIVTPLAVFGMLVSAQAPIFAMFGGGHTLGTGAGSLYPGASVKSLYARYAADFPGIQGVIYGVAIIAVILFAPEGILWKLRSLRNPEQGRLLASFASVSSADSDEEILACRNGDFDPEIMAVANLSKAYGGLMAANDLSLSVKKVSYLALSDPTGPVKRRSLIYLTVLLNLTPAASFSRGSRC